MKTETQMIQKILDHYGLENQMNVAQEECAELIQAIAKIQRANKAEPELLVHLAEELADVRVMCAQLEQAYGLWLIVDEQIRTKLRRQLKRMAKEEQDDEKEPIQRP